MKKWMVIAVCMISCLAGKGVFAQSLRGPVPVSIPPRCRVDLSENKTSHIIFPYAIQSVDRGSGAILAQVVKGSTNILELKAAETGFTQTNLTVITTDGRFYSFLVNYNQDPRVLNLSFVESGLKDEGAPAIMESYNQQMLDSNAAAVLMAKDFLHTGVNKQEIRFRLSGVYLKDGLMWFKLLLLNHSQVSFSVDDISFSVLDKKQGKRTARQEIQLSPVYSDLIETVEGHNRKELVLAFKPFTLSHNKQLKVFISNKSVGRNLVLNVPSRKLLRARALE